MKKVILFAITAVMASAILLMAGVGAADDQQQNPKTEIYAEKTYFAFYSELCGKGAAAVCLDNRFAALADCEKPISLCSVDGDDNRTVLYEIGKENVRVWFCGETKRKTALDPKLTALFGGLSGVGLVVDSEKTNLLILLDKQPAEPDTRYYLYIPEDYFLDENGKTSAGAYIELRFGPSSFCKNVPSDMIGLFEPSFSSGITNSVGGTA